MEIKDTELPNEPAFVHLLKVAREVRDVIFYDPTHGVESDFDQLLTDIVRTRKLLRESTPNFMFDQRHILLGQNPYIFLLTDMKYDYTVGALAILSIGGAFIPLPTDVMPEEVLEHISRSKSKVILASDTCMSLVGNIQRHGCLHDLQVISSRICVKISPTLDGSASFIGIDENAIVHPERPSMVLFTSGTSGPPKGVVHTRKLFNSFPPGVGPGDVVLHHQHPSWVAGALPLIRHPLAGARLEVISSDPAVIWKRLHQGGVTILTGNPRIWNDLMRYFKHYLCSLPSKELNQYIAAAQNLRLAQSGGMVPSSSLMKFWREEIGRALRNSYGATELGGRGLCTSPDTDVELQFCIGRPRPTVEVKLSDGDNGEILIKNPVMFSHYLGDEAATQAAFTKDGFFRTGDIARKVGEDYILEGRAERDIIKNGTYKVSLLEVEQQLLNLPFIQEACIVSVLDSHNVSRVAALVRFEKPNKCHEFDFHGPDEPSLDFLRDQLATNLPVYMLPTALRILREGEYIPQTASHKIIKSQAVQQYFQLSDDSDLFGNVELCNIDACKPTVRSRAWDAAGK